MCECVSVQLCEYAIVRVCEGRERERGGWGRERRAEDRETSGLAAKGISTPKALKSTQTQLHAVDGRTLAKSTLSRYCPNCTGPIVSTMLPISGRDCRHGIGVSKTCAWVDAEA